MLGLHGVICDPGEELAQSGEKCTVKWPQQASPSPAASGTKHASWVDEAGEGHFQTWKRLRLRDLMLGVVAGRRRGFAVFFAGRATGAIAARPIAAFTYGDSSG